MDFSPYIGLAKNPLSCDGAVPTNLVNGIDGITLVYLDELPELPLSRLKASWNEKANARLVASKALTESGSAFLGGLFQVQKLYSGGAGKGECTQYVKPDSLSQVLPFQMRYLKGGEVWIPSLGLLVDQALPNQLIELYKVGFSSPLKSISLNILAKSYQQYALPGWSMPMDGNRYELRTTLPANVRVGNNIYSCGGCGQTRDMQTILTDCCPSKAGGWMTSLISKCNYDPLFEQLLVNDRTKLPLAYMLAYYAGYVLCSGYGSGEIERSTVLGETDVKEAGASCLQQYENRLNWLKMEIPKLGLSTENTCFKPVTPFGWYRGAR